MPPSSSDSKPIRACSLMFTFDARASNISDFEKRHRFEGQYCQGAFSCDWCQFWLWLQVISHTWWVSTNLQGPTCKNLMALNVKIIIIDDLMLMYVCYTACVCTHWSQLCVTRHTYIFWSSISGSQPLVAYSSSCWSADESDSLAAICLRCNNGIGILFGSFSSVVALMAAPYVHVCVDLPSAYHGCCAYNTFTHL